MVRENDAKYFKPAFKWSVVEAAVIMHEPTPWLKLLAKAIIGFDWHEQGRR